MICETKYLRWHPGVDEDEFSKFAVVGSDIIKSAPTIHDLATRKIPDSLICPMCEEVMKNATCAQPCGDVFCRGCIEKCLASENKECPECGDALEPGNMPKSGPTQRKINNIQLHCENGVSYDQKKGKFSATGWQNSACQELLSLQKLENHTCPFSLSPCPNRKDGCEEIIEKQSFDDHIRACAFKTETCRCGLVVLASKLSKHEEECEAFKVKCPHWQFGCAVKVKETNLSAHLQTCPYEAVKIALYKPVAEKALEDCFREAIEKLSSLDIEPAESSPDWEFSRSNVSEELLSKFESLTENCPPEIRDEIRKKLAEKLEGPEIAQSCEQIYSSKKSSQSSSSGYSLEKTVFTHQQLAVATNNFSEKNLLGKGGFGSVYRGLLYGTPIAVKKLHEGGNVAEFEFEVNILRRIRHPNIVLLMGCCPESFCIVSEFLPGGSLEDRLDPSKKKWSPLEWKDRLRVLAEVSSALLYMHKNNILHRDLKPANILLTDHNESKLADMGLAKMFDQSLMASGIKGTLGYLDPNQLATGELHRASDVYAFGLIMLQVLTGHKRVQQIHTLLQRCGPAHPRRDIQKAAPVFLACLDKAAGVWGEKHARKAIEMALMCVERLPEYRPDLEKHLQPELYRIYSAAQTEQWGASICVPNREPVVRAGSGGDYMERMMAVLEDDSTEQEDSTVEFERMLYQKRLSRENSNSFGNPVPEETEVLEQPKSAPGTKPAVPVPQRPAEAARQKPAVVAPPKPAQATQESESQQLFEEGKLKFEQRSFFQAYVTLGLALKQATVSDQTRSAIHCLRAGCLFEMRPLDYNEVISESSLALSINPTDRKALLYRSKGREGLLDYEAALEDLDKLIRLDPGSIEAKSLAARIKAEIEKSKKTETSSFFMPVSQMYTNTQPVPPSPGSQGYGSGHYGYYGAPASSPGSQNQRSGKVLGGIFSGLADQVRNKASKVKNSYGSSQGIAQSVQTREVGNKQFRAGSFQEALQTYDSALALLPQGHADRAILHGNRAACFLELQQLREAVRECDLSLAVNPAYLKSLLRRARANHALGNLSAAMSDIRAVLAIDATNEEALSLQNQEVYGNSGGHSSGPISATVSSGEMASGFLHATSAEDELAGVHFGHYCDGCGCKPICGTRYKSVVRSDYELCRTCFLMRGEDGHSQFEPEAPPESSNGSFVQSLGYPNGICAIRSEQHYVYLLQMAAQKGNAAAMCDLGLALQAGLGIVRNDAEAFRMFNLAATHGYPHAKYILGRAYLTGRGVNPDPGLAATLFQEAAVDGHSGAQFELGNCFLTGCGRPYNEVEGVNWVTKAAEKGHQGAQRKLAACYSEGRGVPRDYDQASRWYTAADAVV